MADCQCSGLQIGCDISSETGQYTCLCGGNTQGDSCQECQPFYRQQLFKPAQPCEGKHTLSYGVACRELVMPTVRAN